MKKPIFAIVAMFCLFILSAYAGSGPALLFEIPFDFVAGDEFCPSGEYVVSQTANHTLLIKKRDSSKSVFLLANSLSGGKKQCQMVFNRYGDKNFLFQVWGGESGVGSVLPKSRTERSVRDELTSTAGSPQVPDLAAVSAVPESHR